MSASQDPCIPVCDWQPREYTSLRARRYSHQPAVVKSFVAMLRLSERASGAVYASRLHRRLFSSNLSLIKTVRAAGRAGWRGAGCTDSLPPAP